MLRGSGIAVGTIHGAVGTAKSPRRDGDSRPGAGDSGPGGTPAARGGQLVGTLMVLLPRSQWLAHATSLQHTSPLKTAGSRRYRPGSFTANRLPPTCSMITSGRLPCGHGARPVRSSQRPISVLRSSGHRRQKRGRHRDGRLSLTSQVQDHRLPAAVEETMSIADPNRQTIAITAVVLRLHMHPTSNWRADHSALFPQRRQGQAPGSADLTSAIFRR
jgi:hypothetical protein